MIEHKSIARIDVDFNAMTADRRVRLTTKGAIASIAKLPGGVIRAGDVVELVDDGDGDCLLVALAAVERDDCDQWVARPLEWPPRHEYVNQTVCDCGIVINSGTPEPAPDMVNHPPHYALLQPEPIDVIEGWGLGFHLGNAVKYIARAGRKTESPIEDLKKARFYLDREIRNREKKGSGNA